MGGGHDGLLKVFHGHHGILDGLNRRFDPGPVGFDNFSHEHQQVGPHGESFGVVSYDHAYEVLLHDLQRLVDHLDDLLADRVHEGMEFQTGHAISHVDQ